MEDYLLLLRWIHFLSGVLWIGVLYYFNFVLAPFFAETEVMVHEVPRALWCFRWGALAALLSGILIYVHRLVEMGGEVFFSSPYGITITVGGLMGTVMFFNGWVVMWPRQKVVIESATRVSQGGEPIPEAPACGQRVNLASKTNTLFSIPMLFFMGAASHYTLIGAGGGGTNRIWFWIFTLGIIVVLELNALIGTQGMTKKPLASLSGTLWAGFILTAVLWFLFLILL